MNATNKSKISALNLIGDDSRESTPQALLARILDLETVAAEPLAELRQAEADATAKAADAAKAALSAPMETIETLSAKLAAMQAQQAAKTA